MTVGTYTTNLLVFKPTPANPSNNNVWGGSLNTDFDLIDQAIAGVLSLSVAGAADVVLTSSSGALDQARYAAYVFTGVLTGNITVFWPQSVGRVFSVRNSTTGAFTLTLAANNGSAAAAGAQVVVPQGQTVMVHSDGTNVLPHQTAPVAAIPAGASATASASPIATIAHGQCRLAYVGATSVKLSPYNGAYITIKGITYILPSGGVTAANTGVYVGGVAGQSLAASTLYYVYLFNNSATGVLTTDFSTTAPVADTTAGNIGVYVQTGDTTRSLVGMVLTNASSPGQFTDSAASRCVATWFNRVNRTLDAALTSNVTGFSTSGSFSNRGAVLTLVTWSDEAISLSSVGYAFETGGAGAQIFSGLAIDGATALINTTQTAYQDTAGNQISNVGVTVTTQPSQGNHTFGLLLKTTDANAWTYNLNIQGIVRG